MRVRVSEMAMVATVDAAMAVTATASVPRNVVLEGHVLARLRERPDACVQTIVTSPPYLGLRAYGTDPQVWGGRVDCEHIWMSDRYYREGGNSASSALAFSEAGEDNARRVKETTRRRRTATYRRAHRPSRA